MLVVVAIEPGGRWSDEFIRQLAFAKARGPRVHEVAHHPCLATQMDPDARHENSLSFTASLGGTGVAV